MSIESVLKKIEENGIKAIRFEQTSISGVARSKTVHVKHFKDKATRGMGCILYGFASDVHCGDIEGTGYFEEVGGADAIMFPDFDTFQILPWTKNSGRILMEPTYKGKPVEGHPRVVARRQLEKLKEMGMSIYASHEHEFYLVDKKTMKPVDGGVNFNATIRNAPISGLIDQYMEYLPQIGLGVERFETEHGPGMMEITYEPAFGIRAADNAHTYRTAVKEIAILNGYVATFMAMPFSYHYGCVTQLCHSLWDADEKKSLMYDPEDELKLSQLARHWIAGLLAHAPALQILEAPHKNDLLASKQEFGALHTTWGIDNRTVAYRVMTNGEKGTYIESRIGGNAANPYITLAAEVAAGIDGIVNKMEPPPPVIGFVSETNIPPNTKLLPATMEDALDALLNDKVICDALGPEFIRCFTAVVKYEMNLEKKALEKGDENWEFDHLYYYA